MEAGGFYRIFSGFGRDFSEIPASFEGRDPTFQTILRRTSTKRSTCKVYSSHPVQPGRFVSKVLEVDAKITDVKSVVANVATRGFAGKPGAGI